MNDGPAPLQTLFLWALLAEGGGAFKKDTKPDLPAKDRKRLEQTGLIEVEKRPSPGKKPGVKAMHIALTETGWQWAAAHLDAEVPSRSTAGGPILRKILARLKSHLERHHFALAEVIGDGGRRDVGAGDDGIDTAAAPPGEAGTLFPSMAAEAVPASGDREAAAAPGTEASSPDVSARIRQAYRELANGRWGVRVRLADLRRTLADIPRERLDGALWRMEESHALVVYPLDDPRELRPEDAAAALVNSIGDPRHVVYLEEQSA